MSTSLDQSDRPFPALRNGLVDELCEFLEGSDGDDPGLLCAFAREFFAKVPRQLIAERTLDDLAALTRGAFELLQRASEEGVTVEVVDPAEEGWSAPVTVIRAELRDRPFIVDTIREYLSSENLPIHHYVYPVVGIERKKDGSIERVVPAEEANPRALVHCEVPPIRDAARRGEIQSEIERRLEDVVAATDDFKPMLEAIARTVETVAGYRDAHPERAAEFAEIENFLHWLTEENFVFLGYREYETVSEGKAAKLRVRPGSGLGILRREERSTWGGRTAFVGSGGAPAAGSGGAAADHEQDQRGGDGPSAGADGLHRGEEAGRRGCRNRASTASWGCSRRRRTPSTPKRSRSCGGSLRRSWRARAPSRLARLQGDHHDLQLDAEGGSVPGIGRRAGP
jgi:hypothetical protein